MGDGKAEISIDRNPDEVWKLVREFGGLAPCGPGNPDPLVAVLGLTVTRVRAATGGHSQLTLRRSISAVLLYSRSAIALRPNMKPVSREPVM